MKILFVVSTSYLSEPLGVMLLSSICKASGHETETVVLGRNDLNRRVYELNPDVVAYSIMSSDIQNAKSYDQNLVKFLNNNGKKVFRIMGGPHPTYHPKVFDEMKLDAICQGDGDRAFPELLKKLDRGESISGIPNIGLSKEGAETKELFDDLDSLPFLDRDYMYNSNPYYRASGLRSFVAARGCPFSCSYCFNHVFNNMFKSAGKILRKRSVENLISEIEYVIKTYPPVKFIRFGDDTFTYKVDKWLEEFVEKYGARINLPFYCLMRSNTLTEDTARLLSEAGCRSISMSIETGSENVRNIILKRNISNETVLKSFEIAKKYNLKTYANTMVGIPGTTLDDDFKSLNFVRMIKPSAPTFTILCPYPGTEIWNHADNLNLIDHDEEFSINYSNLSVLNSYTQKEKEIQAKISYFGALFCYIPKFLLPIINKLIKSENLLKLSFYTGKMYQHYRVATRIFYWAIPKSPKALFFLINDTLNLSKPN